MNAPLRQPLRHTFTLSMDEHGHFWLAIPSTSGRAEPTWSKLPMGYSEKDGVRMEGCLRQVMNARIAGGLAGGPAPRLGASGAPTSWETERWFTDRGVIKARSTQRLEAVAKREALMNGLSALLGVDVKALLEGGGK